MLRLNPSLKDAAVSVLHLYGLRAYAVDGLRDWLVGEDVTPPKEITLLLIGTKDAQAAHRRAIIPKPTGGDARVDQDGTVTFIDGLQTFQYGESVADFPGPLLDLIDGHEVTQYGDRDQQPAEYADVYVNDEKVGDSLSFHGYDDPEEWKGIATTVAGPAVKNRKPGDHVSINLRVVGTNYILHSWGHTIPVPPKPKIVDPVEYTYEVRGTAGRAGKQTSFYTPTTEEFREYWEAFTSASPGDKIIIRYPKGTVAESWFVGGKRQWIVIRNEGNRKVVTVDEPKLLGYGSDHWQKLAQAVQAKNGDTISVQPADDPSYAKSYQYAGPARYLTRFVDTGIVAIFYNRHDADEKTLAKAAREALAAVGSKPLSGGSDALTVSLPDGDTAGRLIRD